MRLWIVAVLLCGALVAPPAAHAADNAMKVSGGVVLVEQVGSPAQWFATVQTSEGPIRVLCSDVVTADCSAMAGSVPALLNTGGCYPVYDSQSGSAHVWACQGAGTGQCRTFWGFLQGNSFSSILTAVATGSAYCY